MRAYCSKSRFGAASNEIYEIFVPSSFSIGDYLYQVSREIRECDRDVCAVSCGGLFIYLLYCVSAFIFVVLGFFGKFVVCSTVVVLVTDGSHHFAKKVTL